MPRRIRPVEGAAEGDVNTSVPSFRFPLQNILCIILYLHLYAFVFVELLLYSFFFIIMEVIIQKIFDSLESL